MEAAHALPRQITAPGKGLGCTPAHESAGGSRHGWQTRNASVVVKHALITGGAGFIGSHLAEALLARDYHVTVLDDESTGSPENLAAVRGHFQFSYVRGTAADKSLVRRLLADVDEVYHLAAAVGVD